MCVCLCIYIHKHTQTQANTHKHTYTHTHTHTHTKPKRWVHASHCYIVFMTRGTCTCAYACTVRAYAERERATLHTFRCVAHVHGAHACAC